MRVTALAILLLAATVVLADDQPKPRPKLIGTVKVDRAVETVMWLPDGKHFLLLADGKGLVVGRDQLGEDASAKPVAEFDLPAGGWQWLGLTPDDREVFVVSNAGSRFNAESRVCFWAVKDLTDGKKKAKPDRVLGLEVDNPTDVTFGKDGKTVLAVTTELRPNTPLGELPKTRGRVVRVDAKTGDTGEEVVTLDDPQATLVAASAHPNTARVFAHFQADDEHVIRGFDTATGKKKWERRIDEPVVGMYQPAPRVSPDGGTLVAFCGKAGVGAVPVIPGQPQPPAAQNCVRPQLLNAVTGAVIADLGADDVSAADVPAFSTDGKVMFGWLNTNAGTTRHVLWETKTGKPLKTWTRPQAVTAADFAPGKYELATVERVDGQVPPNAPGNPTPLQNMRSALYLPPQLIQQPVAVPPAPGNASVVGVWDLSAVVK